MAIPRCPDHGTTMGRRSGPFGFYYACDHYPVCKWMGAKSEHDGQWRISDQRTRDFRILAHAAFDGLRKDLIFRMRKEAYVWLSSAMGMSLRKCHIGHFDEDQCKEVIRLCEAKRAEEAHDEMEGFWEHKLTKEYE